ncbi:MAG: SH3 domain-containing protein [Rhodospirillaceae bacterium]
MVRARALALAWVATAGVAAGAAAAEFKSVANNAAILFDAPSSKAKRLYIVSRGYPLEVTVQLEGWTKVRDANGTFSWVETRDLADRRTVIVKTPVAPVRQAADDQASVVFEAQQNVVLEVIGNEPAGWLQIKHEDGSTGYIKAAQVWGS